MPYRIAAEEALARWRAAQRKLVDASPGDPEADLAEIMLRQAKADYQAAVDAAHREHLPEPPPFPEHDEAPPPQG